MTTPWIQDSIDCDELCIENNGDSLKTTFISHKFNYESVTVQQCFDFCNDKDINSDNLCDLSEVGSQPADHYKYVSDFIHDSNRDIMV